MGKKQKVRLPAQLSESATAEQCNKYSRARLNLKVLKTVYAGVALLLTLLVLFMPCFTVKVDSEYTQGKTINYSISVLQVLPFFNANKVQENDLDILKKTGGVELLIEYASQEKRVEPALTDVQLDVSLKKGIDLNVIEQISNVDRFIIAAVANLNDRVESLRKSMLLSGLSEEERKEKAHELVDKGKKVIKLLLDNYIFEVERRNFSGLNVFISSVAPFSLMSDEDEVSDSAKYQITEFADTFLLGSYDWDLNAINVLREIAATKTYDIIPYFHESFSIEFDDSKILTPEHCTINSMYEGLILPITIGSVIMCIFTVFNLIYLITAVVSAIKMYVKKGYIIKRSFCHLSALCTLVLLFPLQIMTWQSGNYCLLTVSVGAIITMICAAATFAVQLVYNKMVNKAVHSFVGIGE